MAKFYPLANFRYLLLWALLPLFLCLSTLESRAQQADIAFSTPLTAAATITATHSITLNPNFSVNGANGTFTFMIVAPSVQNCNALSAVPTPSINYVMTLTPRQAFTDASTLTAKNTCEVMQTIEYFDGFGRPLQTVQVKGNPDASKDVVMPLAYDEYGRQPVKYLPYTVAAYTPGAIMRKL